MEFDDMKNMWAAQDDQTLFSFDETALLKRIPSNVDTLQRMTVTSACLLIGIYLATGAVLLYLNPHKPGAGLFLYIETGLLTVIAGYIIIRLQRLVKESKKFDRSIRGDLDHAISLAGYQIHISQIIRWNFLPMGLVMIGSGWEAGKLLKVAAVILISVTLGFYVTSKGYQVNKKRKRELQALKQKLENIH